MWGDWAGGWRYASASNAFRGYDLLMSRPCALDWAPAASPRAAALRASARVLADLDHPHLAPLVAAFDEVQPRAVRGSTEPCVGVALDWDADASLVRRLERATRPTRLAALGQVADALRYLHQRGYSHEGLTADHLAVTGMAGRLLCMQPQPRTDAGVGRDLSRLAALCREVLQEDPPSTLVAPDLRSLAGGGPWQRPRWVHACLQEALERGKGGFYALQGGLGVGRSRLARHLLAEAVTRGLPTLDLSTTDQPLACLNRLFLPPGTDPTWDRPWLEQVLSGIAKRPWPGAVYLGRLDGPAGRNQRLLLRIGRALSEHGALVVVAGPSTAHAQSLPLPALSPSERRALAGWAGCPHAPAGDPSAVARLARLQADSDRVLSQGAQGALHALATLPAGVPARAVGGLPQGLRSALPELTRTGYARFDALGTLFVDRLPEPRPVPEALATALQAVMSDPVADLDPLWLALAWCTLGRTNRAAQLLEAAIDAAGPRTEQLAGLCVGLARAGHRQALLTYARIELDTGDPHRALVALERAPANRETRGLMARARRLVGDLHGVLKGAEPLVGDELSPALHRELAYTHLQLGSIAEAERACDRAEAGHLDSSELRALIALGRVEAGQAVDVEALIERASASPPSSGARGVVGRVLVRLDQPDRAAPFLSSGARQAESMAMPARAAIQRLELGRLLAGLGRNGEARAHLRLAREAALAGGLAELGALALEQLIHLDQAQGDLAAARQHAADLVAASPDPSVAQSRALARLHLADGAPEQALAALDRAPHGSLELAILRGKALVATGRIVEAQRIVDTLPRPASPSLARELTSLRGRIYALRGQQILARVGFSSAEPPAAEERPETSVPAAGSDVLEMMELVAVTDALRSCGWQQSLAADRLAISKYRLHRILQKHGLLDWVRENRAEERRHSG